MVNTKIIVGNNFVPPLSKKERSILYELKFLQNIYLKQCKLRRILKYLKNENNFFPGSFPDSGYCCCYCFFQKSVCLQNIPLAINLDKFPNSQIGKFYFFEKEKDLRQNSHNIDSYDPAILIRA